MAALLGEEISISRVEFDLRDMCDAGGLFAVEM